MFRAASRPDNLPVQRDLVMLRRWASAVERDARRSLGGSWEVDVDDSYVMTVRFDDLREEVLLGEVVDEDAWPPHAWGPQYLKTTLDDEAAETVADEFLEVLRLWDVEWMSCSKHDRPIWHGSSLWICAGPTTTHDVALMGELPPPGTY
jgi:hypothetical protein